MRSAAYAERSQGYRNREKSAPLKGHINFCNCWNDTVFLTQSGNVGMVHSMPGENEALQTPAN